MEQTTGWEVRLLGPVEVRRDGQAVALSGRRQRTVLALLALRPGQAVSAAALIETLWSDDPPATAAQQIHSAISALRRVLGDSIRTTPVGYQLLLPTAAVDAHRFAAEVEAARRSVQSTTAPSVLEGAAELLGRALALWRGPALLGIRGLVGQGARLEDQRMAATEERIGLMLALGRHDEVLADLGQLVDAHPLRERLVAHRMLALYRAGRRADALEAYRQAEKRLTAELGLDPGKDLRQLNLAMLRADPALDLAPTGPAVSPVDDTPAIPLETTPANTPAPAQLPPDITGFAGRGRVLSHLDGVLTAADRPPVVIAGTAGVGKTALAVHWAHRVRATASPTASSTSTCAATRRPRRCARSTRWPGSCAPWACPPTRCPSDADEAAALYRTLLADRRVLVRAGQRAQPPTRSGRCCPAAPAAWRWSPAATTSPVWSPGDGAQRLVLDVLTPAEAHRAADARARRRPGRAPSRRPPPSWPGCAPTCRWRCGSRRPNLAARPDARSPTTARGYATATGWPRWRSTATRTPPFAPRSTCRTRRCPRRPAGCSGCSGWSPGRTWRRRGGRAGRRSDAGRRPSPTGAVPTCSTGSPPPTSSGRRRPAGTPCTTCCACTRPGRRPGRRDDARPGCTRTTSTGSTTPPRCSTRRPCGCRRRPGRRRPDRAGSRPGPTRCAGWTPSGPT